MKTMKKLCCLLLAFALLLSFGCKKNEPAETPDLPETPEAVVDTPPAQPAPQPPAEEEEPVREIHTYPALQPETVTPEQELDSDDLAAREAACNSYREVGYFVEWQLGEEYFILETIPGDQEGEYLLWGMRIKTAGIREPFQLQVKVTPDGKDFSLLSKKEIDVTQEWKAVQNYRWLVSTWNLGPRALLESLGFEPIIVDNVTDIAFDAFQGSMLTMMTQKMYDAHWADFFWEQEGKLAFADFGGAGDHYLVERVQPQEDGTYLSHEFIHDSMDTFSTFAVQVELEELPNGAFRVAAWDADNTAIMEQ